MLRGVPASILVDPVLAQARLPYDLSWTSGRTQAVQLMHQRRDFDQAEVGVAISRR